MAVLIRAYKPQDASEVVRFFSSAHAQDKSLFRLTLEDWERFTRREVNANGRDFFVAVDTEIMGLATSSLRTSNSQPIRHFRVIVHPAYRRQGIGMSLLKAICFSLDTDPGPFFQNLCPTAWPAAQRLYMKCGFVEVEREIQMAWDGEQAQSTAQAPSTLSIERVSDPARYAEQVSVLHNISYKHDAAFVEWSVTGMAEWLADGAELIVARKSGSFVGYCQLESEPGAIWIESVATEPTCRRQGIAAMLCFYAMQLAVDRGCRVLLQVSSNNPSAFALYRKLGFREIAVAVRFRANRSGLTCAGIGVTPNKPTLTLPKNSKCSP
jgi:ribosomal protein S18 acetylase RimI-like enzyme